MKKQVSSAAHNRLLAASKNKPQPIVIGELPPVQELAMMLHATCREHISIEGFRFFGTSWAQISSVLEKYGYETKPPF